ncbi:hypothetical protein BKA93DRAFT_32904 [Sparassis latifolia]
MWERKHAFTPRTREAHIRWKIHCSWTMRSAVEATKHTKQQAVRSGPFNEVETAVIIRDRAIMTATLPVIPQNAVNIQRRSHEDDSWVNGAVVIFVSHSVRLAVFGAWLLGAQPVDTLFEDLCDAVHGVRRTEAVQARVVYLSQGFTIEEGVIDIHRHPTYVLVLRPHAARALRSFCH